MKANEEGGRKKFHHLKSIENIEFKSYLGVMSVTIPVVGKKRIFSLKHEVKVMDQKKLCPCLGKLSSWIW